MNYLQITICLLAAISSARMMPVEEPATMVSTTDETTDFFITTTLEPLPESTQTPNETLDTELVKVTTEEPSVPTIEPEDPSIVSSSQTVEIRLHPQMLRTTEPKEPTPVDPSHLESTTTTLSPTSISSSRGMDIHHHHGGSFGDPTGRLRSKDSIGGALRRAVTGTPIVQKLHSTTTGITSGLSRNFPVPSLRSKAVEATARKIVGFSSSESYRHLSSNSPVDRRLPSNLSMRKENFLKNRLTGHRAGGETPANTHIDPLSTHWLYGTSKDSRRPVDLFRLPSAEQDLGQGLTDRSSTTTNSPQLAESSTAASVKTTVSPSQDDSSTSFVPTTTRPATPAWITPERNYATPEINHGTPETNHGTPETNHGTPEINHGISSTTTEISTLSTTLMAVIKSSDSLDVRPSSELEDSSVQIPLDVAGESITELAKPPLDGSSSSKQEFGVLSAGGDDCDGADCPNDQHEIGLNMGQLDELDQDAHKYQVEEKTPDGYIIGEFGVISRSNDGFRGVRYIAHKSIDKQLIQDMLQTFLSLK